MKNNRSMKRRGFTLVELLIVIVVIGVLSAMMMLSSTEAVSSARASNIVSNLRNLKTAALAWYADHLDTAEAANFNLGDETTVRGQILKYLNNESDTGDLANYKFVGSNTPESWYVYYNGGDNGAAITLTISQKLEGRAESVGLLKGGDNNTAPTSHIMSSSTKYVSGAGKAPYMYIR